MYWVTFSHVIKVALSYRISVLFCNEQIYCYALKLHSINTKLICILYERVAIVTECVCVCVCVCVYASSLSHII